MEPELRDDSVVLTLDGEVDMENVDRVRGEMLSALPSRSRKVVLDLDRARYFDSSAIRMLYEFSEEVTGRGGSLLLALAETAPLRRVIEITRLDTLVPVHDSVESALASDLEEPRARFAR